MNYSKRGIQVAVVRTVASACKLPWILYILLTFFVLSKISYTFIVLNELRCNNDLAYQVSLRGMNSSIKKLIRKRKRAFRKAKRSQSPAHWAKFKQIRNDVVTAIRQSKKSLLANSDIFEAVQLFLKQTNRF